MEETELPKKDKNKLFLSWIILLFLVIVTILLVIIVIRITQDPCGWCIENNFCGNLSEMQILNNISAYFN